MNTALAPSPTCTAFLGLRRVAFGPYADVAAALARLDLSAGGLLVFDDRSGAQVDYPWPEGTGAPPALPAAPGPSPAEAADATAASAGVGRPRLGVVAREVTLLPRHWDWLAAQRGGASAALRRLVDEARRAHAEGDAQRLAKECAYRFMSALGGGLPGFEEASRALFAHDAAAFAERVAHWPPDVRAHLAWMTREAFATTPPTRGPTPSPTPAPSA